MGSCTSNINYDPDLQVETPRDNESPLFFLKMFQRRRDSKKKKLDFIANQEKYRKYVKQVFADEFKKQRVISNMGRKPRKNRPGCKGIWRVW